MARQQINIGTSANDGTGDPLRTAFDKINDNQSEIYTNLGGDSLSNLGHTGNTLQSLDTNGNIVLSPNGTGTVEFPAISFNDNNITGSRSNENLNISASGTGNINVASAMTTIGQTVTGNLSVTGDVTVTGATDVDNIKLDGNTISITNSNGDLTLSPNGTGNVTIGAVKINGTTISSDDSSSIKIAEELHVSTISSDDSTAIQINDAVQVSGNITASDATFTTATADEFVGEMNGEMVFDVRNETGSQITKGTAVYISGIQGNTPLIAPAQANSASTMPAFGLAVANIADNATGQVVTFGSKKGLAVANFGETGITFALGDTVYISASEAGKLTNVAPAGESNFIQNIGKIERATPTTNITIKVGGAGRSNATPALDEGNIFIGNSSNNAITQSLATAVDNAGFIKLSTLKTVAAASTDFADFQARIAAL